MDQSEEENVFNLTNFRNKFKFDPHDLVSVVEKYILAQETENSKQSEEKLGSQGILITQVENKLLVQSLMETKKYQDYIDNLQSRLEKKEEEITELEITIVELDKINEKICQEKEILVTELSKKNEKMIILQEQMKILELKILKNLYKNKTTTNMTEKEKNSNNIISEQKVYILE